MICLQLFLARTCYFWRKKRKKAFGIQMFFVQFCQYKWYTSGIYHLPPIFREPETAIDFRIFSELLFFWTTNPRPFGRFLDFRWIGETPHAWQLERSGWGRFSMKCRWENSSKVGRLEDEICRQASTFSPKRHQKLWWLNPSILRDAIHRVMLVTTQKIDSG